MSDYFGPRHPSDAEVAVEDYFFDPLQHLLTGRAFKGYEDTPIQVNEDGTTSGADPIYHDPSTDGGGYYNPLNVASAAKDEIFSWFSD